MDFNKTDWKEGLEPILMYLDEISEPTYREFSKKITPGDFKMLGVRIPTLKKIAKSIYSGDYRTFLMHDDGNVFEVRLLKGLVISNIKDLDEFKNYFEEFLPLIYNWAVCDVVLASSKIIKKDRVYFFKLCQKLLTTEDEFANRISFVIFLDYFIDEEYLNKIQKIIRNYKSNFYYSNMALAWLLSVMFVKFPIETKAYLLENKFDENVTKYMVRKIKDSYRVSREDKEWLKNIA